MEVGKAENHGHWKKKKKKKIEEEERRPLHPLLHQEIPEDFLITSSRIVLPKHLEILGLKRLGEREGR